MFWAKVDLALADFRAIGRGRPTNLSF